MSEPALDMVAYTRTRQETRGKMKGMRYRIIVLLQSLLHTLEATRCHARHSSLTTR